METFVTTAKANFMKDTAVVVVLFLLMCSLWAWIEAFSRVFAKRPILVYEPRRRVPWGLLDLLLAMVALVLFQALALVVLRHFFGVDVRLKLHEMPPETRAVVILASSLASVTTALVSVFFVRLRTQASWIDLGFDRRTILADVKLGVVAFVMLAPPVYAIQAVLVQWFPSQHPLISLLNEEAGPFIYLVTGLSAVLVAPLVEEYLFRVLLQGWLERALKSLHSFQDLLLGDFAFSDESGTPGRELGEEAARSTAQPSWLAIAISAALFAALHASHGPDPIPLFVLALGLGYLYQRTHRILPGIIVHLLLNGITLAVLFSSLGAD